MDIAILDEVLGLRIPGGCEHCEAYQVVRKVEGIYLMTVYHDDWCPNLNLNR